MSGPPGAVHGAWAPGDGVSHGLGSGPLSGGRRNRLWGNRGWGEKELATGCIGYVLVRGPGKGSREEPGEDRRPCSMCADDHYGGQAGQQE